MSTTRNKPAFITMLLYILLLVAALFGAIVSAILMLIDGFSILYTVIILLSMLATYWTIRKMIFLYGNWKHNLIKDINDGAIEVLDNWKFSESEWADYLQWLKQHNKRDVLKMGSWAALFACLLFGYFLYPNQDFISFIIYTLIAGLAFGSLFFLLFRWGHSIRMKGISSNKTGNITFTDQAIVINNQLIYFNLFGSQLESISILKKDAWDILELLITTDGEETKSDQIYFIPIPRDKMNSAEKLVYRYRNLDQ
ncbi:MAG TPA: hypothetical protein DIS90_03850 [Cytophagales bacterium]|nr:hypothetical protein [Cytophagales bacterium]HCR55115.1 hypothetical protein [Cytophagales bacterium]